MSWALLLLTLPAQVEHPPQRLGDIEATLTVTVPERTDRSNPRVLLAVTATGPAAMRVEPATFGDEVRSWRVLRWSSWTPDGDRLTVAQTFLLEQTRSGQKAVPGVRLRVRTSPEATPQQFEWSDPLGPPWTPLGVDVPPPDPATGTWLRYAVVAGLLAVAVLGLLIWTWTRRPAPRPAPTPAELAQATLRRLDWSDPRTAATRLSDTLRTFLSARTGLDLHARTVAECLELLRGQPVPSPEQTATLERLLLWCDATRFAGPAADASDGPAIVAQARQWIASFDEPNEGVSS
jgi:hypothetical protein